MAQGLLWLFVLELPVPEEPLVAELPLEPPRELPLLPPWLPVSLVALELLGAFCMVLVLLPEEVP